MKAYPEGTRIDKFGQVFLHSRFKDSNGNFVRDQQDIWLEVQPVRHIIKNWNELPKSINPKGKGKATSIKAESQARLNPFFEVQTSFDELYGEIDEKFYVATGEVKAEKTFMQKVFGFFKGAKTQKTETKNQADVKPVEKINDSSKCEYEDKTASNKTAKQNTTERTK